MAPVTALKAAPHRLLVQAPPADVCVATAHGIWTKSVRQAASTMVVSASSEIRNFIRSPNAAGTSHTA